MRSVRLNREWPGIALSFKQTRGALPLLRAMSSEVQGHTSVEENSGTNGKRERERADEVEGDRAMGKSRKVDTTAKIYGTRSSPSKTSLIEKALDNAFGPLKLDDLHVKETVGSSKTRNHANPLGVKFLIPLDPPSRTEWSKIYSDPTKVSRDTLPRVDKCSIVLLLH